jgi:hypothetical protein
MSGSRLLFTQCRGGIVLYFKLTKWGYIEGVSAGTLSFFGHARGRVGHMSEFTQRHVFGSVVAAPAPAVTAAVLPPVSGALASRRLSSMSALMR